jgi:hypothetical protein
MEDKIDKYLLGKIEIDRLFTNNEFILLSEGIIKTKRGSSEYNQLYNQITTLLQSLNIKDRVVIIKIDGAFYYDSSLDSSKAILAENHNSRPEIMSTINFTWGNPMINKTAFPIRNIYPLTLEPLVSGGYGMSTRISSITNSLEYYIAKVYSNTLSPLSPDLFTLRVSIL